MFNDVNHRRDARGTSPERLDDEQRHALFVAELQVLPDDWSRSKCSWWEFGRTLRAEFSELAELRAA